MGTSSNPTVLDYAALVRQAEAAVGTMKDAELRKIAFEKILSRLMGDGLAPSNRQPACPETTKARTVTYTGKVRTEKASRGGPIACIQELVNEGFFNQQRTMGDLKTELANRGRHFPRTSLSAPLQRLTQGRVLRRQKLPKGDEGAGLPSDIRTGDAQ